MIVAVVGLCYYVQEVLLTESKSQCAIVQRTFECVCSCTTTSTGSETPSRLHLEGC